MTRLPEMCVNSFKKKRPKMTLSSKIIEKKIEGNKEIWKIRRIGKNKNTS